MSTKKRLKKRFRSLILMIIIIALAFFLIPKGLYFLTSSQTERDLKKLNYSNEAITLIIDNKLDKYLINKNIYSKTLEVALTEGLYEKNLLEEYVYFPYKDYGNYITQLNSLNLIGYSRKGIEQVFKSLDKNEIDVIIKMDTLIDNLASYIVNDYFDIDALDRYVNYKKVNKTYDYDKVISYVSMFLDYPYYEHDIKVTSPNDLLVIANKYYKLSSDFVPKDLVKIDAGHSYSNYTFEVVPVVKETFDKMVKDMEKIDLGILVKSAYRSYQTQLDLYNDYVKKNGKEAAETFSARAGYSEHQTGLAIDICASNNCDYSRFDTTPEYKWMEENAYKYGFIMRYQDNKTNITGYKYESWHYRYVGKDVAKYIYENKLTFDEYYAMFIANKKD